MNKRYVMVVSLLVMAVSIVFMARAPSVGAVIPVLVAFAASQGGTSVIPQSLIADYLGRRSYATIQGYRSSVQMGGIIAGPIISGYAYDTTGSYTYAFFAFSAAALVSMGLVFMAKAPVRVSARID